jgi:calcium/calmodulin-dependent protein kinase (CaM kinase) II
MSQETITELLRLNQRLLDSIAAGDWAAYQELCDPSLTAIEPEAPGGQVVEGLAFHRFYFDIGGIRGRHQTTMTSPRVRLMGDAAVVSYVRLIQRVGGDGNPVTVASAETRIWQKIDGRWKHVHFHRSALHS